jgi:hypothetical protein
MTVPQFRSISLPVIRAGPLAEKSKFIPLIVTVPSAGERAWLLVDIGIPHDLAKLARDLPKNGKMRESIHFLEMFQIPDAPHRQHGHKTIDFIGLQRPQFFESAFKIDILVFMAIERFRIPPTEASFY